MITIEVYYESPECMPSGQKTSEAIDLGKAIGTLVFKALTNGAVTERLSEGQISMRMHLIGGWSRMVTFTGGPEDLSLLRSTLTSYEAFAAAQPPLWAQMLTRTFPGVSPAHLAIVNGLNVSAVESILSASYDDDSFVKACLKDLSDKENPAIAC